MAFLAPWLRAADPIASASAGANIGLTARARDLQEAAQQQAAEEFIAKLNQQAQQFSQHLASQHEIAASRLAQALRAQDALDVYRKGELDLRNKEIKSREGLANDRLAAELLRQDLLDTSRQQRAADLKAYRDEQLRLRRRALEAPSKLRETDPDAIIAKKTFDAAIASGDADKIKSAQDQLRITLSPPGTYVPQVIPGQKHWYGTDDPTTNWVKSAQALQPTNAPAALAPAAAPKSAVGGYKLNAVYGGMKYLGGDPNDPSNWQSVR